MHIALLKKENKDLMSKEGQSFVPSLYTLENVVWVHNVKPLESCSRSIRSFQYRVLSIICITTMDAVPRLSCRTHNYHVNHYYATASFIKPYRIQLTNTLDLGKVLWNGRYIIIISVSFLLPPTTWLKWDQI